MASRLPENPSIERLRSEAKALRDGVGAADPEAFALVAAHHPRPDRARARDRFALHDAQVTLARRYGFSGWPALVRFVEVAASSTVDPGRVVDDRLDPADRFCSLASLRYDGNDAPPRWRAAAKMLDAEPDLVDRHVWAAASAGDTAALRWHLAADPGAAHARGGPLSWPPLLYLTYSRMPSPPAGDTVVDSARTLLSAGADPNAGFLWCGLPTPFTALTGVLGEGESGRRRQPPHPHADALADILLTSGAHPVDRQGLYNRMFSADDAHLRLLLAHGAADAGPSPWERLLGEALPSRAAMWQEQADWAARRGFTARLRLLADHGIDVTGSIGDDVSQVASDEDDGSTPLHSAAFEGDLPRLRELLTAGADRSARDARYGSTAQEWAEWAYQDEAADLLRTWPRPG